MQSKQCKKYAQEVIDLFKAKGCSPCKTVDNSKKCWYYIDDLANLINQIIEKEVELRLNKFFTSAN